MYMYSQNIEDSKGVEQGSIFTVSCEKSSLVSTPLMGYCGGLGTTEKVEKQVNQMIGESD